MQYLINCLMMQQLFLYNKLLYYQKTQSFLQLDNPKPKDLMASQSKMIFDSFSALLLNAMFGTRRKKIVTASILLIVGFLLHMRNKRSNIDNLKLARLAAKESDKGKGNVDSVFFERIKELLKIVIPSWKCVELLDLVSLTFFLILRTYLSIYLAGVNGKIVKAIIQLDLKLFLKRVLNLGVLAIPASFVNSMLTFINKRLAINFRRRLTNHFHGIYLKDMIYYQLCNLDNRIKNPDQRLTSDIEKWSDSLSMIYSNFSKPLLDILLFSRKLAELVGWIGPTIVVLWYFISGMFIRFISPPFGRLTAIEQKLEGVYRAAHTDLVHHSEEIAFYKGNEWEKSRINSSFEQLTRQSESINNKKLFMGVFDSMLVKYGAVMVGYAVVGLPVFGPGSAQYLAKVGSDAAAITRDYVRNSSLLINLAKAIGRLVISYKEIQQLAGYTSLVYELKEALKDLERGEFQRTQVIHSKEKHIDIEKEIVGNLNQMNKGTLKQTDENIIVFKNVPVTTPNGEQLVKALNFEIKPGMNTIVSGPNGSGKSSLFRLLSGLWPITAGEVIRPHFNKLFYIPQRAYLPAGTLRDQIIYPHTKSYIIEKGISDADLLTHLKSVSLEYLVDREGGFDAVNDWNDVLSGGEKQRIAMSRLFYHQPVFAILDECTSAVSIDVEANLYNKAKQLNITLFTVSHRVSLFKFHEYMLKLDGQGGWTFGKIELVNQ